MSDSYETDCSADAPSGGEMWPTPRVGGGNRNSRMAVTNPDHGDRSGLGLEQMVEIAQGMLPEEYEEPEEMAPQARRVYTGQMWPTPRAYSFDESHRPGLTPPDIRARGLYPHKKRYWPAATDGNAPAASTRSSAARLASRLRRLVSALATGTTAGSGMRHCASLATSAHGGPYWSSPQVSLAFDMPEGSRPLDEYSGSWPRSAIASATTRGAPVLWARRTDGTGSSSSDDELTPWPTPLGMDAVGTTRKNGGGNVRRWGGNNSTASTSEVVETGLWPTPDTGLTPNGHGRLGGRAGNGRQSGASLEARAGDDEVRAWPSPAARDWRDGRASERTMQRNSRPLNEVVGQLWPTPHASPQGNRTTRRTPAQRDGRHGLYLSADVHEQGRARYATPQPHQGQLSPDWVELLMALPIGWTDPDCAEPQDWPGWPARPGWPQQAYESPRLAGGVKHRVSRLKALGNAVVAAQALPLFQAIMDVERAECEDGDADV